MLFTYIICTSSMYIIPLALTGFVIHPCGNQMLMYLNLYKLSKFSLRDALVLPLAVLVPSCVLKRWPIGREPHSDIKTSSPFWELQCRLDICRMQEALNKSIINLSPAEIRERECTNCWVSPPNYNVNVVSVCWGELAYTAPVTEMRADTV